MEELPRNERIPDIDFLDDNLKVFFRFEEEAATYLPEITPEDLETRIEKYRILLGRVEVEGENVKIVVSGILEMQDEPVYYKEEKEAVSGINIPAVNNFVKRLQEAYPEEKHSSLVGDVHTHPILAKDFENGLNPWMPSPGDIESIIGDYERGVLSKDRPFLFGIAGLDESGETHYSFYRIVHKDGKYEVREVELD